MPPDTIGGLQVALLEAVLLDEPLPGLDRGVTLPDLAFLHQQPRVVVADENLLEPRRLDGFPVPVEILSMDAIRERTRSRGNVAYLRFQPVERDGDVVWLTLRGEIAPADPNQRLLGLSGVRIGFRRSAEGWVAIGGPTTFAA